MKKSVIKQAIQYWKHWRKDYLAAQLSLQYNGTDDETDWIGIMRSGYYEACAEIKELEQMLKEVK